MYYSGTWFIVELYMLVVFVCADFPLILVVLQHKEVVALAVSPAGHCIWYVVSHCRKTNLSNERIKTDFTLVYARRIPCAKYCCDGNIWTPCVRYTKKLQVPFLRNSPQHKQGNTCKTYQTPRYFFPVIAS